jgi:hypothetical protein
MLQSHFLNGPFLNSTSKYFWLWLGLVVHTCSDRWRKEDLQIEANL